MSGHTKGPWKAVKDSQEVDGIVCDTMNGDVVIPANGQELGCYTADAVLIAAAPDLLEALEALQVAAYNIGGEHVTGHEKLIEAADKAQAAIAKARGEV